MWREENIKIVIFTPKNALNLLGSYYQLLLFEDRKCPSQTESNYYSVWGGVSKFMRSFVHSFLHDVKLGIHSTSYWVSCN